MGKNSIENFTIIQSFKKKCDMLRCTPVSGSLLFGLPLLKVAKMEYQVGGNLYKALGT